MDWADAKQRFAAPPFDSIRVPLERMASLAEWPGIARLNDCAPDAKNFRSRPIRFVANNAIPADMHYETHIAESGEIATRENWHDFFNAMSWLAFPQTKSAISEMHARLLSEKGESEIRVRSTARDVLTLFDEGGIIVTSTDDSLLDLIRSFDWKTLFMDRRDDVMASMRFYLFGHSMLEKALDPYVGVTAKAILFGVDDVFISSSPAAQMHHVDQRAAAWLMTEQNLSSSKNFSPLPWLGVPGWWDANESPDFYDNTNYFRNGRRREQNAEG